MKWIPPTVQMQQALMQNFQAGIQGRALGQFVVHVTEVLLQIGLEEMDGNPGHAGRRSTTSTPGCGASASKRTRYGTSQEERTLSGHSKLASRHR